MEKGEIERFEPSRRITLNLTNQTTQTAQVNLVRMQRTDASNTPDCYKKGNVQLGHITRGVWREPHLVESIDPDDFMEHSERIGNLAVNQPIISTPETARYQIGNFVAPARRVAPVIHTTPMPPPAATPIPTIDHYADVHVTTPAPIVLRITTMPPPPLIRTLRETVWSGMNELLARDTRPISPPYITEDPVECARAEYQSLVGILNIHHPATPIKLLSCIITIKAILAGFTPKICRRSIQHFKKHYKQLRHLHIVGVGQPFCRFIVELGVIRKLHSHLKLIDKIKQSHRLYK